MDDHPYIEPSLQTLAVPIDSIKLDPRNARLHPQRNLDAISSSLKTFRQQKPIVVRADGICIAGNGTLEAARALGWTHVAVIRTTLTGNDAQAYGIADNRTGELAEWDDGLLVEILSSIEEGPDLSALACGFTSEEIVLLSDVGNAPEILNDEVPSPPNNPVSALGDRWQLGDHVLVCGDATDVSVVQRLFEKCSPFMMVTDPPYGVSYDPQWRSEHDEFERHNVGQLQNDDRVDWSAAWSLFTGDVAYVWHAGVFASDVARSLSESSFCIRAQIVWCKQHFVFSRGHYHWQHEPCWYCVRKGQTSKWCGSRDQSTVWQIANSNPFGGDVEDCIGEHPTTKPVECMARPIRNHGQSGDVVYDPFLGSGTTLIAAEHFERRCFGIELEPKYCDVIIERWQNMSGRQAVRC